MDNNSQNTLSKEDLILEIKELIDINSDTKTYINIKYIEYFEVDELLSIRDGLIGKKEKFTKDSSDFLDEIFTKCSH